MSQLTVNGITVPVAADGWRPERVTIGDETRSASGKLIKTVVRTYRKYAGRIVTTSAEEAEALVGLIRGDGYGWSFDTDLYADGKALGYTLSGTASTVVASDTGISAAKYGAKFLKVPTSAGVTWTHNLGCAQWTAMTWKWTGSAWGHIAKRSDTAGGFWDNGVYTSGSTASIAGSSTAVSLYAGVSAPDYFDDLVFVPYLMPAVWFATVYAGSSAWAKPPLLTGGGTLLSYGGTTMRGNTSQAEVQNRGALDHLQRIEFTLQED